MKKIVFYFLVLLLAVWVGVVMHDSPGYVLISYRGISVETSLWFASIFLIILFVLFYGFLRIGVGVSSIFANLTRWVNNRKKRQARKQTILGLYDLLEGKYLRAEKKLSASASHSDMRLINYLAAAFAAKQQNILKRSGNYLRLANMVAKDHSLAVGLVQARIQIDNKELEEASKTLQQIHKLNQKSVLVLRLLQQVYLELKDWYHLKKLIPKLRKMKILEVQELASLEEKIYSEILLDGTRSNRVENVWREMPKYLCKNPLLVKIYVEYLLSKGGYKEAENIIKIILRKNLDKGLLDIYAGLKDIDGIKHLTRAEKWLKGNQNNVDLLLCLGKICRRQKFWGKARNYLERGAKLSPSVEIYTELAWLMKDQNDLSGALDFYNKAISCLNSKK